MIGGVGEFTSLKQLLSKHGPKGWCPEPVGLSCRRVCHLTGRLDIEEDWSENIRLNFLSVFLRLFRIAWLARNLNLRSLVNTVRSGFLKYDMIWGLLGGTLQPIIWESVLRHTRVGASLREKRLAKFAAGHLCDANLLHVVGNWHQIRWVF